MSSQLHVETFGAGPPLVMLHGWAMHSGVWEPLAKQLAARFRVHAVDLPGHGGSPAVAPCTLDQVTMAVAAHFGDEPDGLALVGWSLGGQVALRWSQIEPQRIVRLALVATTPRFFAGADWPHAMSRELLLRFGDELRVSYRLTILRFLSLQLQGTVDGRSALADLRRRFFERVAPEAASLVEALSLLAASDLRAAVPMIRQPALVVAGDRDTLVPFAAARWLSAALPHARFAPIAGAAHVPFLSHPGEFTAALAGFLDD